MIYSWMFPVVVITIFVGFVGLIVEAIRQYMEGNKPKVPP